MLISTKPKNSAQAAALARARQLTEFKWTPVRDIPAFLKKPNRHIVLPAGVEVKGFPYSSTELQDKFFTENVSIETFLSAISNPHSKLYQPGHGALNAGNYGVVCNGFVRYAFGIQRRVNTARWFSIPGMRKVAAKQSYSVEDIELLDVLHANGEGSNHVALITDILRDESGAVAQIEVSEATRPHCKRTLLTPDEFYKKYPLFCLCRYDKLDEVPPLDAKTDDILWNSGIEKASPRLCVDNGNKSNYLYGEEVVISVFNDGNDTVEVTRNNEPYSSYPVEGRAIIPFTPEPGYYKLRLLEAGDTVEFCVNRANVSFEVRENDITIKADPCDSDSRIIYMDFRGGTPGSAALVKYEELTDEEKASGVFTRTIPEGGLSFKVYYENAYGVWTHQKTYIFDNGK